MKNSVLKRNQDLKICTCHLILSPHCTVLVFSNFLNYNRFEFEKKLKTFLELNQELRTFLFFQRKHIRTETTIFIKINVRKRKNPFGGFATKNAKKNRKKNCSNMSIHCAVLWPDEHLKCKCSNMQPH